MHLIAGIGVAIPRFCPGQNFDIRIYFVI